MVILFSRCRVWTNAITWKRWIEAKWFTRPSLRSCPAVWPEATSSLLGCTTKLNKSTREREREEEIKQQQIDLNLAPVLIFPTSTHRVDGSALNSSGFHQVLLGFLGFYSVAVGWTGFLQCFLWSYRVYTGFFHGFIGFYSGSIVYSRFYGVSLGFTGFYLVLPGYSGFYRVLPGFIGIYSVSIGWTGFL